MNIYVGNISPDTTEDQLREAFAEFGEVGSVNIVRDRATGESRGFGFVNMSSEDEANDAIEQMNEKELNGSTLRVERGKDRPPSAGPGPRRPGGRDRGPGGRGRRPGGGPRGRGRSDRGPRSSSGNR